MEALETIIERLARRIDYVLNNPPRTNRVGEDEVTTFDGKEYKNLSGAQVNDLLSGAYWGAYRSWEEAVAYQNKLYYSTTPTAEGCLRAMRKNIKYN